MFAWSTSERNLGLSYQSQLRRTQNSSPCLWLHCCRLCEVEQCSSTSCLRWGLTSRRQRMCSCRCRSQHGDRLCWRHSMNEVRCWWSRRCWRWVQQLGLWAVLDLLKATVDRLYEHTSGGRCRSCIRSDSVRGGQTGGGARCSSGVVWTETASDRVRFFIAG